jgi:DNA repair photolyase
MRSPAPGIRGRGTAENPPNRFERFHVEPDPKACDEVGPSPATQFFRDRSCSIISYNDSPDVGFAASVNPYRGCEHGCPYCYARPTHEYLGFSAGLEFETRIVVKPDAPELLRQELASAQWQPQPVALSGVTDCYQPVERRLQLTRRCLQVLAQARNPVCVVTKNHLVTRDIDLLSQLAAYGAARVYLSLTTLDAALTARLEPRASLPAHRLAAISALRRAGVPVGVLVAPVIPGLNDHEIPALLQAAAQAGASFASYSLLRLPQPVATLFEAWLQRHFPLRKDKVLNQLCALRGGRLDDPRFGFRMRGQGPGAERLAAWFELARRRADLASAPPELCVAGFRRDVPADTRTQQPGLL